MSVPDEPKVEVRGMVGKRNAGTPFGSSWACFHVKCIQGMAQGPVLRIHECITAVEQREAFRVIELAREDYVRVELISAVFLSLDDVLLFARAGAGIQNGSGGDEKMLEHEELEFHWETLEWEGCWDDGFLNGCSDLHVYRWFF